jgi:hypothetical protein
MSKIVKVQNGDYKIVVGSVNVATGIKTPGTIVLDTNPNGVPNQGVVNIKGDLLVEGTTTTVNSETVTIEDNIIELNTGWNGSVSQGKISGLTIDQGTGPSVNLWWDRNVSSNDPSGLSTFQGSFVFKDDEDNLRALVTNSINAAPSGLGWSRDDDLAITVGSTNVIRITNTNYEDQILDYARLNLSYSIDRVNRTVNVATVYTTVPHSIFPGDLVYVDCTNNPSFNEYDIYGNLTTVIVIDTPTALSFRYANTGTNTSPAIPLPGTATGTVRVDSVKDNNAIPNMRAVADYTGVVLSSYSSNQISENDTRVRTFDIDTSGVASNIEFDVDGSPIAKIDNFGLKMTNGISIIGNQIISSDGTIRLDRTLQIVNRNSDPVSGDTPSASVYLYSKNGQGTGGTGLYFKNTLGTKDELISKTKALLYSLIL